MKARSRSDVVLTAKEVANLLHLHVNTVKRLSDRGELPCFRVNKRGDRRYHKSDIAMYLASVARMEVL